MRMVIKHKVRLVTKELNEIFAPVACTETIRLLLSLAAQLELEMFQLNVRSVFLNGDLEEEVYIEQS